MANIHFVKAGNLEKLIASAIIVWFASADPFYGSEASEDISALMRDTIFQILVQSIVTTIVIYAFAPLILSFAKWT